MVFSTPLPKRAVRFLGWVFLSCGAYTCWLASRRIGIDFASLYLLSKGMLTQAPVYRFDWQKKTFSEQFGGYVPFGLFYPPSTGLSVLPLGVLSYQIAQGVWLSALLFCIIDGTRRLVRAAIPDRSDTLWPWAASFVLFTACIRWGMTMLQGAPLVTAVLAYFIVMLHERRMAIAFLLATWVLCFKMTLALPFLGIFLLYRRYGSVLGALAVYLLLNSIGFIWLGPGSLREYLANMRIVEDLRSINSPVAWIPASAPRLDWLYLFTAMTGGKVALARIASGLVSGYVAWRLIQYGSSVKSDTLSPRNECCFLFAISLLSTACVYHHHYDLSPVMIPLLLLFLTPDSRSILKKNRILLMPLIIYMLFFPIDLSGRLAASIMGQHFGWIVKLAGVVCVSLAQIASLRMFALEDPCDRSGQLQTKRSTGRSRADSLKTSARLLP